MEPHKIAADAAAAGAGLSSPWWLQLLQIPVWLEPAREWLGFLLIIASVVLLWLRVMLLAYRVCIMRLERRLKLRELEVRRVVVDVDKED
jgi:hypothetical protein